MRQGLRLVRRLAAACLLQPAAPLQAAPPTLHFVTKPFAPYAHVGADSRPAGPMVELLQAACAEVGWHCTVDVLPWRRALGMAARGEVDGAFPVVDSPARRAVFRLSPEIVRARYVLIGRQDGRHPGTLEPRPALRGRTVAAYGPSDALSTLQQLAAGQPDVRVEVETDHATVLRKLSAGRYGSDSLALVNETVVQALQSTGLAGGLRPAGVVKQLAYTYAFVPERVSPAQAEAFARALQALCRSGRTAALFQAHDLSAAGCRRATIAAWHKENASPQISTNARFTASRSLVPPPGRPA